MNSDMLEFKPGGEEERIETYDNITDELRTIYIAKNSDYGNSFEKSLDEFGSVAFVVRASDKMERIK